MLFQLNVLHQSHIDDLRLFKSLNSEERQKLGKGKKKRKIQKKYKKNENGEEEKRKK